VKAWEGQRRLSGGSSPLRGGASCKRSGGVQLRQRTVPARTLRLVHRGGYCPFLPPEPPRALVARAASLLELELSRLASRRTSRNSRASAESSRETRRLSRAMRSCSSAFLRSR